MGEEKTFDFKHFESLPRNEIVSAAQTYLNRRFPAGSDLQAAQNELISAGAKCARGVGRRGVYYECDYERPAGIPFVTIEWKIILRPDADEKKLLEISVNRALTGL
ncbi:hypothetical protein [Bradyrhizobium sp. 174]|uniref:hypothetical protein n=1 Tax=Bradyrhizobium sp. 174 TaxID=2782645 RepID=UPI001FFBD857|nr:hypothetical protein [Bradyrhizobium sp. 174]MCK1573906.1 hypothetical protein [Bradyrhizobium sp. 174]